MTNATPRLLLTFAALALFCACDAAPRGDVLDGLGQSSQALSMSDDALLFYDDFSEGELGPHIRVIAGKPVRSGAAMVLRAGTAVEIAVDASGWPGVALRVVARVVNFPGDVPAAYTIQWATAQRSGTLVESSEPTRWETQSFVLPEAALRPDLVLRFRYLSGAGFLRLAEIAVQADDEDQCEAGPCQNDGVCTDLAFDFACECSPLWTGRTCGVPAGCTPDPCVNGGICEPGGSCACTAGWQGERCETDVDECAGNPDLCGTDVCINTLGSYRCSETLEVFSDDFDPAAPPVFEGDATMVNGVLILKPGQSATYSLDLFGYEPLSLNLNWRVTSDDPTHTPLEVDWFTEHDGGVVPVAAPPSVWTNQRLALPAGLASRDLVMQLSNASSSDIVRIDRFVLDGVDGNQCLDEPCANGGTCIDEVGRFVCECPADWEGSRCTVPQGCYPDPCRNEGVCSLGGVCSCPSAWTGEACELDVDECELDGDICGIDVCANTPGGYTCTAPAPGAVVFADDFTRSDLSGPYEGNGRISGQVSLIIRGGRTVDLPLSTVGLSRVSLGVSARSSSGDGATRVSYAIDGSGTTQVFEATHPFTWQRVKHRLPREAWSNPDFRVRLSCDGSSSVVCRFDDLLVRAHPQHVFSSLTSGVNTTCGLRAATSRAECWGDAHGQGLGVPPVEAFVQLAVGEGFACGLGADESVVCWGAEQSRLDGGGTYGRPAGSGVVQLSAYGGNLCLRYFNGLVECVGDHALQAPPVAFATVATGADFACGLAQTDGGVSCWGNGGDGASVVDQVPMDDGFVEVVAGDAFACGLHEDGSTRCWGYAGVVAAVPSTPFETLAASDAYACGMSSDAKVTCWGDTSSFAEGRSAPSNGELTQLSGGASGHVCALTESGHAVCWGDNAEGQLDAPVDYSPHAERLIAVGGEHACAIRGSDAEVQCWGRDYAGEVGNAPNEPMRMVAVNWYVSCGLRASDSTAVCWGSDDYGHVSQAPSDIPFASLSVGAEHACGVRERDREVVCWGAGSAAQDAPEGIAFDEVSAGAGYSCGVRSGDLGAQCWGGSWQTSTGIPNVMVSQVAAGRDFACGLRRADRYPECWSETIAWSAPGESFVQLDSGRNFACGVRSRDRWLWCWGNDSLGQVSGRPWGVPFEAVSTGANSACGIRAFDRRLQCWGAYFGTPPDFTL